MNIKYFQILLLTSAISSCVPADPPPTNPGTSKPAPANPGTPGSAQNTSGNNTSSTTTGSAQNDIVVVVALGNENMDQAASHKNAIQTLLSRLAQKYQGQDVKLALIASPTASISGVGVALPSSGFAANALSQLSFELAPKDAFLGTLVAGCAASSNNLSSSHAAGSIQVCGAPIPIPAHSWSWAVEDLSGKMSGFLRPGSQRRYIFIGSNDIELVGGDQFVTLTTQQNNSVQPKVFAIVPTSISAPCNQNNKTATQINSAVTRTGGKSYSYCMADWTSSIDDLLRNL